MLNAYICSLHSKATLTENKNRKTHRDTDRDTEIGRQHKAQGSVPYLFSLKEDSLEKARSQLAKVCLSTN